MRQTKRFANIDRSLPCCVLLGIISFVRAFELRAQQRPSVTEFLTAYCIDCHSGDSAEGNTRLDRLVATEPATRQRKLWRLIARNLESRRMPPREADQPSNDERLETVRQILQGLERVDCGGPSDPGKPTIRRLSRYEYRNAVRDLLGIDYRPALDFPGDEIGLGFDNIGDTSSVSPLLLEKYLQAAEEIAELVVGPHERSFRHVLKGYELVGGEHSHLNEQNHWIHSNGAVTARVHLPSDGTYRVTADLIPQQAGPNWVKAALLVDGIPQTEIELRGKTNRTVRRQAQVRLPSGDHQFGIAFLNDYYQPEATDPAERDRNLGVVRLQIQGPFDVTSLLDGEKPADFLPRKRRGSDTASTTPGDRQGIPAGKIPDYLRRWLKDVPAAERSDPKHLRSFLGELVLRGYRRPARTEELDDLMHLIRSCQDAKTNWRESLRWGIVAVLVSPHFLFRGEVVSTRGASGSSTDPSDLPKIGRTDALGSSTKPRTRFLNDFELVSRLSFFLWSSIPDDDLLTRAAAGSLHTDAQLRSAVRRMLRDPKSVALVINFAEQAFQLRGLETLSKDPERYPEFTPELVRSMRHESRLFLAAIIRHDLSLLNILDADFTFVDARLAQLYGLPLPKDEGFVRVNLDGTDRGGLLTHGSVLVLTSRSTRNAPVLRGKWILENLLYDPPPPPQPGVAQLEQDGHRGQQQSLREQMERHRSDPQCAACHVKMDALGFALEMFDPLGRQRDRDEAGRPLDTAADLPDGSHVTGVRELRRLLREQYAETFIRGFAEELFVYAIGRDVDDDDECALRSIVHATRKQGDRFATLAEQIVLSDAFRRIRILEE